MHMGERKLLVPDAVETVDFYGDPLIIALVAGKAYVALRPVANFLDLAWPPQYQRIMRDDMLSQHIATITMTAADKRRREMTSLQLEYLPGWLFGIVPGRVKPELALKLRRYREQCFLVLWDAFQACLNTTGLYPPVSNWRVQASVEDAKTQARAMYAYYQRVSGVVNSHLLRARRAGLPATLTIEQWFYTLEFFGGFCAYCQRKPGIILEHFIPLSLGGGTTSDNCIPSCYSCNARKRDRHPDTGELLSKEALERVRSYLVSVDSRE